VRTIVTLLLVQALAVLPAANLSAQEVVVGSGAVLRALDKMAGEATDLNLAAGESATYGRLTVTLAECRYPADTPDAEGFALLRIDDSLQSDPVFHGWMIASSPALNALDHSRYDIWLLRCTTS
jgi:hypothetical protein